VCRIRTSHETLSLYMSLAECCVYTYQVLVYHCLSFGGTKVQQILLHVHEDVELANVQYCQILCPHGLCYRVMYAKPGVLNPELAIGRSCSALCNVWFRN
jgi:hypothetical protein